MMMRVRPADAWPLFDLRIRTERLELLLPTDDQLAELVAVALEGIHPPEEMPFGVAWTDVPSPTLERSFVQHHWHARATWSPEQWNLHLAIVRRDDRRLMGSQTIHAREFPTLRQFRTGSWLGKGFQGQGYGKEMRSAVLGFAFEHLGAEVAETEAFLDNAQSAGVSRALGYRENGIGRHAPRGEPRDTQRFRMTVADWRSRARPVIEVLGLDPCRDLFGLPQP
jgi:RimJ/RimL family protein N-acetyltransferase